VNARTIAALTDPEQWDLEFEMDDGSTEDGEFVRDHYIGREVDGHPFCARWTRPGSSDQSNGSQFEDSDIEHMSISDDISSDNYDVEMTADES
jgi:hypothetical protein